jgi:hypothetical protein
MITYEQTIYESETDDQIRDMIRRVLTTPDGKTFLTWLLTQELGLYSAVNTEEDRILRNLAIRLMERMGAYHEYHAEDITSFLVDLKPYTPDRRGDDVDY